MSLCGDDALPLQRRAHRQDGLQSLRARYYDPRSGRFTQLDPFAGNAQDPLSLHKYLYVHGDPISNTDPSGLMTLGSIGMATSIGAGLGGISGAAIGGIANGTEGAIRGFATGFVLGGVIAFGVATGGAFLVAPLLGVSELTDIYITHTAVAGIFAGMSIRDIATAETGRERAAAARGIAETAAPRAAPPTKKPIHRHPAFA